jgi:DNA helicase II / ATP-dependent DNA helicase PcrA
MEAALPPYLEPLNRQQLEAVRHEGPPLLILAGAGSGKTRVITTKIAYLIDRKNVDPRSILAVTFTNKAAGEMLDRVHGMIAGASGMLIRTFHSFGAWILRRNSALAGLPASFSIYDEDDSLSLLHSIYDSRQKRDLKRFVHWISRAKDYALSPDDDLSMISYDEEFPELYRAYQKRLEEIGNVDFGDLIMKPVSLLRENEAIRNRMQQRFKVVLVDEYQDSNVAQFYLLKELCGTDTYLCVVGDDDQSIYRFRGAEVRNIIQFPEIFPGTEIIRLEENYRSTQNILSIASSVVENNSGRLGKTLWTKKGEGKKAVFALLEDSRAEVEYCAGLLDYGSRGDTAILYRTNAQSREFEIYFSRHGIPYKLVGTVSFYSREEIKDTLAWLHLIVNPADEVAWRRIINKPSRGIGASSVKKILTCRIEAGGDLVRACELAKDMVSSKAAKGVVQFAEIFSSLRKSLGEEKLRVFFMKVLSATGLLQHYKEEDLSAGTQRVRNLDELLGAAAEYPPGEEGLTRFLEDVELDRMQIEDKAAGPDDQVTLITMHNTKGLEFDRVIITGLEDGLFPSRRNSDEEELEEERRIFYVSITRAKGELYMTSCRRRRIWGKTQLMSPSPFIDEIPREFLRLEGMPPIEEEENEFPPGTRIYHDAYGPGTVYKNWHNGHEYAVEVVFDSGSRGRFIPEFTPLERIADEV